MGNPHRIASFWLLFFVALVSILVSLAISCNNGGQSSFVSSSISEGSPLPASTAVTVQVPASMRGAPFDVPRTLNVPAGFSISVLARIDGARFLLVAANGDIFVSNPGASTVYLVRPAPAGGDPQIINFIQGLRNPHGIAIFNDGTTTYFYVAESNQVSRFPYNVGDTTVGTKQVVVSNLPDAPSPELGGAYAHILKSILFDEAGKLYVMIASGTNSSPVDTTADPVRGAIYQCNPDGSGWRLFARGIRNGEGLRVLPGTNTIWAVVNNSDNIAVPVHKDADGDGTDDFGKVVPAYVDNHPPDLFLQVRDGANYAWPFAYSNADNGFDNMPLDPDFVNNRDWSVAPESMFTRPDKGIPAHSAPLGLTFLQNTQFAQDYRNGAVVALHGSWNRTRKGGYKVIYFPWNGNAPGAQIDLVTGWLDDASQAVWGRPVDVKVDNSGGLLISDDVAGTIYRLVKSQ